MEEEEERDQAFDKCENVNPANSFFANVFCCGRTKN
jgi:hypothetical protein